MIRVVFFGTYLSSSLGSQGPSEVIASELKNAYDTLVVSKKESPLLRFLESLKTASFSKIDVAVMDIYSTRVVYQSLIIFLILKIRKKRVILDLHGGGIIDAWKDRKWLFKILLENSSVNVTPSLKLVEFLKGLSFHVKYMPNPLDLSKFNFHQNHINTDEVKLLWVRAFSEIYNPQIAIDALHLVQKSYPNSTLTMVGPDKGLLERMRKKIDELGLTEKIKIVGPVQNSELERYYHEHHIFLNTTSLESFGLAVMEAAACGIPIVSSEVGELPFLWKNQENIVFSKELSGEAFAEGVLLLVENREKANSLAIAAKHHSSEFDLANIVKRWDELVTKTKP